MIYLLSMKRKNAFAQRKECYRPALFLSNRAVIFFFFLITMNSNAQTKNDKWLETLLRKNASPLLQNVLNQPEAYRYQVIYTKIDRDKNNRPRFTNYYLNVDNDRYFIRPQW